MATDPHAGERAALGARCRELLESDLFQEVVSSLHRDYERKVMATGPHDTEKRDRLMLEYHALKSLVARLQDWKGDGDLAQREIQRENSKAQ